MKKALSIKVLPFISLIIILFSSSCVKETIDTGTFDPSLAINAGIATPIGYLNLNIGNFVTDSNAVVKPDASGLITLYYSDSIYTPKAGSLFLFQPVSRQILIVNETGAPIDLSASGLSLDREIAMPLKITNMGTEAGVDSLTVVHGDFSATHFLLPFGGQTTLSFPGIRNGRTSLSRDLPYGQSSLSGTLDGYTVSVNPPDTGKAHGAVICHVHIAIPALSAIVQPGDILASFDLDFGIDEWGMIYGYTGNTTVELPARSFNVTYEQELPEGQYYFADPRIRITTSNSFGTRIGIGFRTLKAFTKQAGNVPLTGVGVPLVPNYFFPSEPVSYQPEIAATDHSVLDKTNSNIVTVVSSVVRTIIYQPDILISSQPPGVPGFISSESSLGMKIDLELPFTGNAGMVTMRDTMVFNPSTFDFSKAGKIDNVVFNLYYENSFPATLEVQLYLADANLRIIDKLFSHPVPIEGPEPSPSRQDNPPVVTAAVNMDIAPGMLDKMQAASYLIAEGTLNTTEKVVRIFDNQSLLLKTGIIFNLDTTIGH